MADSDLDEEIWRAIDADPDGVENERIRQEAYRLNAETPPEELERLVEMGMRVVNRLLDERCALPSEYVNPEDANQTQRVMKLFQEKFRARYPNHPWVKLWDAQQAEVK